MIHCSPSLKHGPRSRNMCATYSGVSPVWNRRRQESCGLLARAKTSARTCPPHITFFVVADQGVHDVCTNSLHDDAWICVRRTTDCDLERQRHEKVNAWIFARPTTDHDLVSVIPDKKEKKRKRENMQICNCRKFLRTDFFERTNSVIFFCQKYHLQKLFPSFVSKKCG